MCYVRFEPDMNCLKHSLHLNGLSLTWILLCRCMLETLYVGQNEQNYFHLLERMMLCTLGSRIRRASACREPFSAFTVKIAMWNLSRILNYKKPKIRNVNQPRIMNRKKSGHFVFSKLVTYHTCGRASTCVRSCCLNNCLVVKTSPQLVW